MAYRRLEQLGAQYGLTSAAVARLDCLLGLLHTAADAPTTVTEPALAVDVHVADSLSALQVPALWDARRIADLGSGAGFPALALAIALPEAHVTAVESTGRKCAFIREIAATLELENLAVACSRAEEWTAGLQATEVVCARAVAPLGVLCEYAAPLLTIGGSLIAWKGGMDEAELAMARRAAAELCLEPPVLQPVEPYPGSDNRQLAVVAKRETTPERFPRRNGVALKRPLGLLRGTPK